MATIAFYGPTNKQATKVVVSIIDYEGAKPHPVKKWLSEPEIRNDAQVMDEIFTMLQDYSVRSVVMPERIIGCPHEEGIDYEEGKACSECSFWEGMNRWTGERIV